MPNYMGIDPGPSTGIAVFNPDHAGSVQGMWSVFQVDGQTAFWLIAEICTAWQPRIIAVEEFEVRGNGGTTGKDAELTRHLAHYAQDQARIQQPPALVRMRKPALVKPWATDKRLTKTGFPLGTKFKDARDAGRHALYAAVRDGREPDPLS